MKKIKIMLLSLTLFAVVGGALAFKANFTEQDYCTTIPNPIDGSCFINGELLKCPTPLTNGHFDAEADFVCYTTTDEAKDCDQATICTIVSTRLDVE